MTCPATACVVHMQHDIELQSASETHDWHACPKMHEQAVCKIVVAANVLGSSKIPIMNMVHGDMNRTTHAKAGTAMCDSMKSVACQAHRVATRKHTKARKIDR